MRKSDPQSLFCIGETFPLLPMDLSNYAVKDFILNESCQKWTLERDVEATVFWENWLNAHPDKAELIAEARSTVEAINETIDKDLTSECDHVWQMITESVHDLERDAIIRNNVNNELLKSTNL